MLGSIPIVYTFYLFFYFLFLFFFIIIYFNIFYFLLFSWNAERLSRRTVCQQ